MSDVWTFVFEVLVLLSAAMVLGAVCERMRQSAMVGYLLAGALLGPNALNLIADTGHVGQIAELGVALLMFSVGLEFSWTRLKGLGARTLAGGLMQIGGTLVIAAGVSVCLGLSIKAGFAVGSIVALSSTAVVLPMLATRGEADSIQGRFALGILLLQDLAVVPLLLIVSAMVGGGSAAGVMMQTGNSFLVVALYAFSFSLFNRIILPHLVVFAAAARSRELPILFAIVVAAGSALLANRMGISPALGAFIAGIFLGDSIMATAIRGDVGPFKTVFATLFFSSIGMYLGIPFILQNPPALVAALAAVVIGKPLVIWVVGWIVGLTHRHALAAGVTMGQVGVFSFVLAKVAVGGDPNGGLFSPYVFDLLVNVTILSLLLTPTLTVVALPIGARVERQLRHMGLGRAHLAPADAQQAPVEDHVIIIGFGPAGRQVADSLGAAQRPFVIVDLNPRTVLDARARGLEAYLGDAATSDVLTMARVRRAAAIAVTLPDTRAAVGVIRRARAETDAPVIVRARYARYVHELETAGAHVVIDEEADVGRRIGDALQQMNRSAIQRVAGTVEQ